MPRSRSPRFASQDFRYRDRSLEGFREQHVEAPPPTPAPSSPKEPAGNFRSGSGIGVHRSNKRPCCIHEQPYCDPKKHHSRSSRVVEPSASSAKTARSFGRGSPFPNECGAQPGYQQRQWIIQTEGQWTVQSDAPPLIQTVNH